MVPLRSPPTLEDTTLCTSLVPKAHWLHPALQHRLHRGSWKKLAVLAALLGRARVARRHLPGCLGEIISVSIPPAPRHESAQAKPGATSLLQWDCRAHPAKPPWQSHPGKATAPVLATHWGK